MSEKRAKEQRKQAAYDAGYKAGYDAGYKAGHNDGLADGWNDTMSFLDEYYSPLLDASTKVNVFMGIAWGIGLAGIGQMPKEMLRELGNIFAYLINDADMQNARFALAVSKIVDRDIPAVYNLQPARETNQAITRYYSGQDRGESLIQEFNASQITQLLLQVRRRVKDRVSEDDAALDNLILTLRPMVADYHEAAMTALQALEVHESELGDTLSGVLKRLRTEKAVNYSKMGEWARTRAKRAKRRVTSL